MFPPSLMCQPLKNLNVYEVRFWIPLHRNKKEPRSNAEQCQSRVLCQLNDNVEQDHVVGKLADFADELLHGLVVMSSIKRG